MRPRLRALEGVLGVEVVECFLFGRVEFFPAGGESVSRARVIARDFDEAVLSELLCGGDEFVFHLWVGGVQVQRVARIGDEHRLALDASRPEDLASDEIYRFFGLNVSEGKLLLPQAVTTAGNGNRLALA